jgi:hypothetical protein
VILDTVKRLRVNLHWSSFVTDSLQQSGLQLLKAFTQHAIDRRENHVHIFCYEHSTIKMKSGLRNISEDCVHFHDCFTDHRGWIKST